MSDSNMVNFLKIGLPAMFVGAFVTWLYVNEAWSWGNTSSTVPVKVKFDDQGCPLDNAVVRVSTSTGKPGQRLVFKSDPLRTNGQYNEFNLSFGPFTKDAYDSEKGELETKKLKKSATPKGGKGRFKPGQNKFPFKYTINAKNCDPVDPIIIIDY